MRRPAVFFDRDNTLIVGNDYLGDPNQVKLVAGAAGVVARCRAMGFATIVVSNQSGVARGMFGEEAVQAVNQRMDELLLEHHPHAVIDRHEYCPFHPDAKVEQYRQDSFLRKPKPGMILAAADAMALDLSRSWVIGDAPRDVAAGKAAGCRTIQVIDPSLAPSPAALESATVRADFTVTTLIEAVELIARQIDKPLPELDPPVDEKARDEPERVDAPQAEVAPAMPSAPPAKPAPLGRSAEAPREASRQPASEPRPVKIHSAEAPAKPASAQLDLSKLEFLSQQVLVELKKLNEQRHDDFSVSKLVAGITQVLALAAVMLGYFLFRGDTGALHNWLLVAIFLQTFTVALLIMSRQK